MPLLFAIASGSLASAQEQINPERIANFFKQDNFDALETIAERLREDEVKNEHGDWQIAAFYGALRSGLETLSAKQEADYRDTLKSWAEMYPKSVTWRIVQGHALIKFAWRERGNGFANTVAEEAWKPFYEYLIEAWDILEEAREVSTDDPELFAALTTCSMALGRDLERSTLGAIKDKIQSLFSSSDLDSGAFFAGEKVYEEGAKHAKYYPPFYEAQIFARLPRWGGAPGDAEKFAASVAKNTHDRLGEAMYARMATTVLGYGWFSTYKENFNFSWERLQQGLDDIVSQYPNSMVWKSYYCLMACLHEDRPKARQLAAQVKKPGKHLRVWGGRGYFATIKLWANGEGPYPSGERLVVAVAVEDLAEVKRLISEGADPDSVHYNGNPPIVTAAREDLVEYAQILLEAGGDPDVRARTKHTAMIYAVRNDNLAMLELLFKHGADPNRTVYDNWTPILAAARDGKLRHAELLMDAGANLAHKMDDGWTALHMAASEGHLEMVEYLLEQGANTHVKVDTGQTPRAFALENFHSDVAALLRKHEAR